MAFSIICKNQNALTVIFLNDKPRNYKISHSQCNGRYYVSCGEHADNKTSSSYRLFIKLTEPIAKS